MAEKSKTNKGQMICALDVGTTKIVALIAEVDDNDNLRVIGAGRMPAHGLAPRRRRQHREATAAIGQAIEQAEQSAGQPMESRYVGIAGSHINAIEQQGRGGGGPQRPQDHDARIPSGRWSRRRTSRCPTIARSSTRCRASTRSTTKKGIQNPVGMFGYRLEVDASIITGASSAVTNLVNCVHDNGLEIEDLVLEPLASAEAVLTDDERHLGVALVDIGGGTSDLAIYLEGAPWHTVHPRRGRRSLRPRCGDGPAHAVSTRPRR